LVVGVPNFDSLARRLFGPNWHHVDLPTHLYHFEPQTLEMALRGTAFRVDRIRQDLLAKEFAPSLGYALGLSTSLDRALLNLLALPFDLISWLMGKSGLITAFATRE
jgi:hypothetical protein